MKSGELKTVMHGGGGGQETLSIDLTGNLYFISGFSKLLTHRNYRTPKTRRCLWSPAQQRHALRREVVCVLDNRYSIVITFI